MYRFEWTHGICPRMTDVVPVENGSGLTLKQRDNRLSFTFRKTQEVDTNHLECNLKLNEYQKSGTSMNELQSLPDDDKAAFALETEHVLQVYDNIAHHFSETRHKPWPQVLQFVNSQEPGSSLLDVGCGNGKYLGHNRNIIEVGCDSSMKLCEICIRRGFSVVQCNCLNLPFSDESFTAVICIAVIHHLSTHERRKAAILEMARVLTVGGQGLVYVWALEQQYHKKKSAYLKQNKKNRPGRNKNTEEDNGSFRPQYRETQAPQRHEVGLLPQEPKSDFNKTDVKIPTTNLPIHENRTGFTHQDMLVPWKLKPQKGSGDSRDRLSQDRAKTETNRENEMSNEEKISLEAAGKVAMEAVNPSIFHRYYHLFREGELESICTSLPCVQIIKSYYDEGNWCVIFEKIA
ncbi:tRNA (carboxymethyluridine(34)-5-O)-methyltransferase ALKBH8-like [Oratosquilla oratoria]|uniref:tRNA (carboxymethyluridine(34)-5-O)-methyltransferase ALKBH8-like n=1 Tax=Oratosquilla oratoria TaxID=337810 RepID=UPI003F75B608